MANEPIITVVGNLVAEPELRMSQAGKPWVTFRIASTPRVKDRDSGEWADGEPLWLGCRAYGDAANHIAASLGKGTRVLVQGRLTQRSYTDNQGQQRTALDLEVDEIGPTLRWASAQVTRGAAGGGGAGGSAASYYGQPQPAQAQAPQGYAQPQQQFPEQPQAQQAWGQPAVQQLAAQQQAPADPWAGAQQQPFSGFDDEKPF